MPQIPQGTVDLVRETSDILEIISQDNLDLKIMLGAWIAKEDNQAMINSNQQEIDEAIRLSRAFRHPRLGLGSLGW